MSSSPCVPTPFRRPDSGNPTRFRHAQASSLTVSYSSLAVRDLSFTDVSAAVGRSVRSNTPAIWPRSCLKGRRRASYGSPKAQTGTIRLVVVDTLSRAPLGAIVALTSIQGRRINTVTYRTSPNGVLVADVGPGGLSAVVSAHGYSATQLAISGSGFDQVVRLQKTSMIQGYLIDISGAPIIDGTIRLYPLNRSGSPFILQGRSDQQGRFQLRGVATNTNYEVRVSAGTCQAALAEQLVLAPNESPNDVTLQLPPCVRR
jgi:hypothetical protein